MKKSILTLLALAASISVSMAQTIVNTGFTSPYINGDLAGQQGWTAMPNTGANAFQVTDSAGSGFADTVPTTLNTNSGNYVYRDTTALGNAASDEWDGVMDFTLSVPVPAIGSGDIFRIGPSTTATNALGTTSTAVPLRLNSSNSGDISINGSDANGNALTMLTINAATMGWAPAATNLVTDQWRLSWKLRKTTVSGTYTMTCSMENLDNPTNLTGLGISMIKTDAYASPGLYTVMGRPQFAEFNGTESINITIDDLSVIKSASNPVRLYPTPVAADAGNAVVNLSWPVVAEATSYDVKRSSTVGGTYSVVAGGSGITTNGFSDTTVVNGSAYYYKVTSKNGAVTADSAPVLAEPDAPITGTIIDTTFSAAQSFVNGDLAGQQGWQAIAASGAHAFNVISSGDGFAETATFAEYFDNTLSRQIYYSKMTSNEVGNAWSGTVVFRFEATPNDGLYATNIVGTTTNIQAVAVLQRGQVFDFGLTSDQRTLLEPRGDDDILINARAVANGDISIGLNGYNGGANVMLVIPRATLGWDPEWADANETNAPIFDTEWVTLDWTMRKTASSNVYAAVVDATIGGTTYNGIYQYTDNGDTANQPIVGYLADTVRFGMGHHFEASGIAAGETNGIVNVNVDALSISHTNYMGIPSTAPYGLAGSLGNLSIELSWSGGFEADSFDVYRSTDSGASYTFIGNTTASTYLDTGLTDLYTYFYQVRAKYAGWDSAPTAPLIIRARGISPVVEWGKREDIVTATTPFGISSVVSNGILTSVGSGAGGTFSTAAMLNAPPVYGVAQTTGAPSWTRAGVWSVTGGDQLEFNDDNVTALLYIEVGGTVDLSTGDYSLEVENNPNQASSWHAAIHDSVSGKWYVGDAEYNAPGINTMGDPSQQSWRELTVASLTGNNTALMVYNANPITTPNLTAVDKVGVFAANASRIRVNHLVLYVGSSPSVYDSWTDTFGIYNADAAKTNDYDHDGRNNVWEWGLGGNPTLPNILGIRQAIKIDVVGADMVYIYPRLKSTARPDYFLTESDNLIYTPFTDQEAGYAITSGGTWTNQPNFEIVTNIIPTADAVKFIRLNIE